jgi:hypothetical protein
MKRLYLLIISTLLYDAINAQTQVANYHRGKYRTNSYESFSFWIKDNKRAEIHYSYGKNMKEVKLEYLGKDRINGQNCFKIRFPNNYTLYIIPKGFQLIVTDLPGKYNEIFSWQYEGPINGIGTYCDVCAEDDKDAMKLMRSFYFQ